nr:hypothetical protein [Tanacetum cinerariifolium]
MIENEPHLIPKIVNNNLCSLAMAQTFYKLAREKDCLVLMAEEVGRWKLGLIILEEEERKLEIVVAIVERKFHIQNRWGFISHMLIGVEGWSRRWRVGCCWWKNYVPWSSRLLRYAKSRPNGKLIHNSILNGPYVRKMISEPGDANREITVTETFHLQTDDELFDKELKQIEADDQAIQTILLGLPEDIYAAVDSCKTAQEIWLRVQQMMKGSDIGIQEKNAKLFNQWERYNQKEVDELKAERLAKTQDPLALMANSNNPYVFSAPHQDQSSFNQTYLQQPMPNPENITDPTTAMNMALALMAKAFKLNYSTPTNNNQRISSNPRNRQIAQPENPTGYNDVIGNQVIQNVVQNPRVQNVGNQNALIGVQGNGNQNQIGNGNLVAARAEGNAAGQNGNQIRCYNCRGVEEEYDLMAAAADLDEIKEVNANCILMANLQQASTSGTQTESAPVYDTDGSADVYENCDDNEIFNMFTQEEQYTELLEPI